MSDGLAIKVSNLKDVDRDASAVSSTGPLRVLGTVSAELIDTAYTSTYQPARLVVILDVYVVVDCVKLVLFPPFLCVLELSKGFLRTPLSSSEISSAVMSKAQSRSRSENLTVGSRRRDWLEIALQEQLECSSS